MFPEGAILLRPGSQSRAGEVLKIEPALQEAFDTVLNIEGPGFADGGDILTMPGEVLIGLSSRTDRDGAKALQAALAKLGRKSRIVETPAGVLHFKTDCSLLDEERVLCTPRLAQSGVFDGFETVLTAQHEDAAANALRVNDIILVGAGFPRTLETIDRLGYDVVPVKTDEIGKIDAGLSCMSLRWMQY